MGQLIKLQDYISRYESDMFRYPGQYIRLKNQQWTRLKTAWENNPLDDFQDEYSATEGEDWLKDDSYSLFGFVKKVFKKEDVTDHEEESEVNSITPLSEDELKQVFLNKLMSFQIKWASSTLREKSFVDNQFLHDEMLKYFLQRFPDTYLLLYKPIFQLKQATIELEIILVSPYGIHCIVICEDDHDSVFLGGKERFWTLRKSGVPEKKVLSPVISLQRMAKVVQSILELHEIDFPVKQTILNRTGFIDFPHEPYNIDIIDKRQYTTWFEGMRSSRIPLKSIQLKAAAALLSFCQTTFVKRIEWESVEEDDFEEDN
ncbi:NERD domain-containing protein [Bacillus sp. HMF5848]|uniref:NERD domain-containing protein n=1 Tax=Bacillus sp. HMF5848 TaxID=2495421 RepID=UPI000F7941C1|nr:NERD domain-containing protein [Bacillus sp. HMF5848]RSK28224.1 NERD domain-containing protein [Bacillus sp. HMF5848]